MWFVIGLKANFFADNISHNVAVMGYLSIPDGLLNPISEWNPPIYCGTIDEHIFKFRYLKNDF